MEAYNGKKRNYTIAVDENGKIFGLLLKIERSCRRDIYKREPEGFELQLTDEIFEEAAMTGYRDNLLSMDEVYSWICKTDEHYAILMREAFKKYSESVVFETHIYQDVFKGE